MRIGIFTDTYLPYISGLVTSELMLKKALEDMGHEVYIVTANLENFKYIKEGKIINIQVLRKAKDLEFMPFPATNDFIEINYKCMNKKNIIKSSPNIIDLIEVGDYVNGEKVCYLKGDINDSEVANKEDALYTEYNGEYGEWYGYAEDKIETIVTKEQFEAIQYRIGESDEC